MTSQRAMSNEISTFKIYDTGFCTHPGCMVERGAGIKSMRFPALAFLFSHPQGGYWLFDTGYSDHFQAATEKMPEKLYALATPATSNGLIHKLRADGIDPAEIKTIVLSHFHADHIAGVHDFPHARLICNQEGLLALEGAARIKQVMKGFLGALLPASSDSRYQWITDYPLLLSDLLAVTLENPLRACEVPELGGYLIALPGHAAGHMGFLFKHGAKWVLLCADAFWTEGNLNDLLPNRLTHLIMDNAKHYQTTLKSLHQIKQQMGESVVLLCSHESNIQHRYPDLEYA